MSELETFRLGDVVVNFDARRVPVRAADRKPGPYPYFGASGIVDFVNDYLFDGEFLLVAEDGENLRTRNTPVAFMARGKFWVNNHAHVLQGNHLANTKYLCYTLAGIDISGFLSGSTQPKLTQKALSAIPVQLPDRARQNAVVEILGALDDKIAANERVTSTCRTIGDLLMASHQAVGAEVMTFADLQRRGLLMFGDGYRTKRNEHGTPGLPILRAADIAHGMLAASTQDYVSERFRRAMGPKISRPGDVVLTTKGTVGRVATVPTASPEFVYSPQLCYFRVAPDGPVSPSFLFYWFRSGQFWSQADSLKGKTDMADYINLADIGSLKLYVPESASLLSQLNVLEQLAMQMQAENRTLAELRGTLLPRLMSGEIRVRDAKKVMEDAL